MADQLTAAGLEIDSLEDRIAAATDLLRATIAPNLDCSPDQPSGQIIGIVYEHIQEVLELCRAIYSGMDPDSATGQALTALALLSGTRRREATYGLVTLTVNLNGGTTLWAGSVANVSGDATNRWATTVDVVAPAGPAADYPVVAQCTQTGPVQAVAGTITVIATPVIGWNTVTNAADAVEGLDEETDTALRLRREQELALGGSTTTDAIRADLLDLTGMVAVTVLENYTDIPVDGIPPRAFESIIWDGAIPAVADADIAEAIWLTKAVGIQPWGLTDTAVHTDDQGYPHTILWTRVTALRILVEVTLLQGVGYVGDAAVADYIEEQAEDFFAPGDDVYRSRVSDWTMDLGGVVNVSLVRLSIFPAAVGAADIPVGIREIAAIDAVDVTVFS